MHGACEHARTELGCDEIWIRADPDGDAMRIYERLGFELAEHANSWARSPEVE